MTFDWTVVAALALTLVIGAAWGAYLAFKWAARAIRPGVLYLCDACIGKGRGGPDVVRRVRVDETGAVVHMCAGCDVKRGLWVVPAGQFRPQVSEWPGERPAGAP